MLRFDLRSKKATISEHYVLKHVSSAIEHESNRRTLTQIDLLSIEMVAETTIQSISDNNIIDYCEQRESLSTVVPSGTCAFLGAPSGRYPLRVFKTT